METTQAACQACGKESADSKFCPHCGVPKITDNVCPSCGRKSTVEFSFCPYCGKAFAPLPSVIETPSTPSDDERIKEEKPAEQQRTERAGIDRSNRIGTWVFGAFAVLSLLVSIIRGIVPIYLMESALWAGAAWYWHRKKTHSELAKAIVIVFAALIGIGEVIQVARQFGSEFQQTRASKPNPLDVYLASQYSNTAPSQTSDSAGAASATSHVADIEKQAIALFNQKRYTDSRSLFEQACHGTDENGFKYVGFDGDMKACNYLGYLYANGLGGSRDRRKALDEYQKACEQGNLSSCASLGSLYQDDGDDENARKYFEKACNGGIAEGCDLLRGLK